MAPFAFDSLPADLRACDFNNNRKILIKSEVSDAQELKCLLAKLTEFFKSHFHFAQYFNFLPTEQDKAQETIVLLTP